MDLNLRKTTFRPIAITIALILLLRVFAPVTPILADSQSEQSQIPSLNSFSASVQSAYPNQLAGIYIQNLLAVPIRQQPSGQPGYVSTTPETVTQFAAASKYGSIGLLAHNYLTGAQFFSIQRGSVITLVYGDGHVKYFQVTAIKEYQALTPTSAYSQFVNLAQPGTTLSSTDLFYQTYGLGNVLILQTCIASNNESSWGRLFVVAEPIEFVPKVPVKSPIVATNLLSEF